MTETTVMELFFATEFGPNLKILIHDPDSTALPSAVEEAMNNIIETQILVGKGGKVTTALSAQIVTKTINELYDSEN